MTESEFKMYRVSEVETNKLRIQKLEELLVNYKLHTGKVVGILYEV